MAAGTRGSRRFDGLAKLILGYACPEPPPPDRVHDVEGLDQASLTLKCAGFHQTNLPPKTRATMLEEVPQNAKLMNG